MMRYGIDVPSKRDEGSARGSSVYVPLLDELMSIVDDGKLPMEEGEEAVSYTHLTLPTIRLV